MQTALFKTNLRCDSCVQKIGAYLDKEGWISQWKVDIESPDKILTVTAISIDSTRVQTLVSKAGYEATVYDSTHKSSDVANPSAETYFPLILIFLYLVGGVLLVELQNQSWHIHGMMSNFMGGFFIIFSFFKILNLKGFAEAYSSYDLIAKRWNSYSYVYPFIELALGIGYLLNISSLWLNTATIFVMSVSSLGVIKSLMEKRQIKCACLGTIFNLPMSSVTLIEDLLMVAMAALMIFV